MANHKDLLPIVIDEKTKDFRGIFWIVVQKIKSLVVSKTLDTGNSKETKKEKSLLFNLDWIEDLEIAEKILDQMSDEEVIWDSDKKSLIKYFHPDIPNKEWENFSVKVRRLIFLRINGIQEVWSKENSNEKNWRDWNTYNYRWRTYYSTNLYTHSDEKVVWIMTKAINEISYNSESTIKVVQITLKFLLELITIEDIDEQIKKDLLLTMRKQVEKNLFSTNVFSIGDLPKEINCEKILDLIIEIEEKSQIPCKRTKRSIVVYYANCGLLRHHHPKRLRERINQFGNNYGIDTRSIWRNVSHVAKWPKNSKINDPNRPYLDKNSAPRKYRK